MLKCFSLQQSIMTCSKMYGILREVGVSISLEQVPRSKWKCSLKTLDDDFSATWRRATWTTWRRSKVLEASSTTLVRTKKTSSHSIARGEHPVHDTIFELPFHLFLLDGKWLPFVLISSISTCLTHTHTLMPGRSLKQRSQDRGKFAWAWTASSPARSEITTCHAPPYTTLALT